MSIYRSNLTDKGGVFLLTKTLKDCLTKPKQHNFSL